MFDKVRPQSCSSTGNIDFVEYHPLHEDNVYVADSYNHRIQKFSGVSLTNINITVVGDNGGGYTPNQLDHPSAVYVNKHENLYIAD
ncbi:unnamed protein product [Rotaria sp. Silwood1]|nr:unnamed protein product [Rotaria sp. Silwood1]